ncbi:MAG TPA: peptidase E [Anaerolineales bacterium]|jgi:peptidase E|nr:peptidase E [Anaerolineales bacterium]
MAKGLRQIIALGGGGFSMEPDNPVLDIYILQQARQARPRVSFVPTATGDSSRYIADFYTAFAKLDCQPSHLAFFQRTPELKSYLLEQDVVYVGGGNTKSMLAVWRDWGLPELLREAWERGVVLAGVSAGAICWFEQCLTDSYAGSLRVLDCLGFLRGSCCPHYDGEPERRPLFHELVAKGEISPGFGLEDSAAIHFLDQEVYRIVASEPGAKVYRVRRVDGGVEEEALAAEYIETG